MDRQRCYKSTPFCFLQLRMLFNKLDSLLNKHISCHLHRIEFKATKYDQNLYVNRKNVVPTMFTLGGHMETSCLGGQDTLSVLTLRLNRLKALHTF